MNVKLSLAALLALSFVSIAVFGFFAMSHNAEHGNCIAKTLQGTACTATDVFGVASYHLSAFQKAAGTALPGAAVLLISLIAVFVFRFSNETSAADFSPQNFYGRLSPEYFSTPQKSSLWRWLAFHENSPNAVLAR